MASYILNALTLRHDHDAAERTLHHFWDTVREGKVPVSFRE